MPVEWVNVRKVRIYQRILSEAVNNTIVKRKKKTVS
jgi:hypothetical protein